MVEGEGLTSYTDRDELSSHAQQIPDDDFELVPLGEDPTKGVKIGAGLPDLEKRQLKACLRENAEMPRLDPEIACHPLTIDPALKEVAQR